MAGILPGAGVVSQMLDASLWAAMDSAERERQREATLRHDAYHDDYRDALVEAVEATFTGANAEELCKVIDSTNNVLKRVTNAVSVLYADPVARKLSSPEATKTWRDLLDASSADVQFSALDRMKNLQNTALLYVRPGYDALALRVVLPQDCTVIPDPDDSTMPLYVEFRENAPGGGGKPCYHQFDRRPGSAGYQKFDHQYRKDGPRLKPQYFDEGGRPLIPVFAIHRETPLFGFWDATSGDDLYQLTLMIGMWETFINHLLRTDSYRQKYATGEVDVSVPQEGGPTVITQFRPVEGGPINVGEFSSQADWMGIGAQIERKFRNVLDANGLVLPDTRTSGDPTSGFALTVRSQGLQKIQKRQMLAARLSEKTFYRIYSAVWNFERKNPAFPLIDGPELPPFSVAKPKVDFAQVESLRTVEERKAELEIAEVEIRIGLASPITVYMGLHPEATEDEARAAIEKNKEDTDSLKPEPPEPPPGMPAPGAPKMPMEPDEMPMEPGMGEKPHGEMDAPPRK